MSDSDPRLFEAATRSPPPDALLANTIAEVRRRYLAHAREYYRRPDGSATGEADNARRALAALDPISAMPAAGFGPRLLKAVRQDLVDRGLARTTINARCRLICRAWRWAVSEELLPAAAADALACVAGLRVGRSAARETDPVESVDPAWVDATLPYLPPTVSAMVQLQLLSGMRPGEVCRLRPTDLDATGTVWHYSPPLHKTAHRDRTRNIAIGPRAQQLLGPFLEGRPLDAYCFTPAQANAERRSQRRRLARRPRARRLQRHVFSEKADSQATEPYDSRAYWQAVRYGIAKANRRRHLAGEPAIPTWSPGQLRHTAATLARRELDLDTARAFLGHAHVATTEIYAQRDQALADKVARRLG